MTAALARLFLGCLVTVLTGTALTGAERIVHALPAGLRLSLPADWVVDPPSPGTALVARSPAPTPPTAESAGGASLTVAAEVRATGDAAAVLDEGVTLLRDQAQEFAVVEPIAPLTIAGLPCARIRYRFATGELRWEQIALATVIDGTAVCVTCGAAAEDLERWLPQFEAALASLIRPTQPTLPKH